MSRFPFSAKLGIAILSLVFLTAVFAPLIAPYDPFEMGTAYQKPSSEHLLGTNDVGQDILSELIYGTRVTLTVGLVSALVITLVGTALGIFGGYFGGVADRICSALVNIALSLPSLALTIVLVAYLNTSLRNLILAICITAWAPTTRIIRSRVQQIRELPFIKTEKTMGASSLSIILRHIVPNIGDIVFTRGVLMVGTAMLMEASLSFLGLGVLGQKSWGDTLHYAFFRNGIITGAYWWYVPPIICISLTVLGTMLLGNRRKK